MAKITKTTIEKLGPGEELSDAEIRGFRARRLPSGVITYGYRFRFGGGRYTMSIGLHGEITADQARTAAKKYAGMVALGTNPAAERDAAREKVVTDKTKTVNAVLDEFEKRYIDDSGLASADQIKSAFARFVRPEIGDDLIYDVTRADISSLQDAISDKAGKVAADRYLAYLRKAFNWQQVRDDKFVTPIIKGMMRIDPSSRARDRVLEDDEIADLWQALDALSNGEEVPVCFPKFVRLLLLTAQRRSEVGQWHSDQIVDLGETWKFEAAEYKGRHKHAIPITKAMRAQLVRKEGYMVSNDEGVTGFSGFSKPKAVLDAKIAELRKARGAKKMEPWTFHDLRRTARTIMSRYTSPDIAERVLGHAIAGVAGIYDRHAYMDEKVDALNKLADHVHAVAQGKSPKVVALRSRAA